jgi:hypothetical protein
VDLQQALTQMNAAGILMRARGDRLSVVSRTPLTEQQRAWIRAHKAELLRLLADPVPDSPRLAKDAREVIRGTTERRAKCRQFALRESGKVAWRQVPSATRVYRFRLIDKPDSWLTMIAPDCDLDEARRCLRLRFGGRVTDVAQHRPSR